MRKIYYIGLDTHKDSIAIAIAEEGGEVRFYGTTGGTLDALDKAIKKIEKPGVELRFLYEAGPCGYVICRHLVQRGFQCIVVSPSLVPRKASDRVKTDQIDAVNLARLFRAGELTPIYIPGEEDEATEIILLRQRCGRPFKVETKGLANAHIALSERIVLSCTGVEDVVRDSGSAGLPVSASTS